MTKEVLVGISGLQFIQGDDGEGTPVEVIAPGDYFFKNNKHYVVYDEVMEGFEGSTRNRIKIQEDLVELTKHGISNVHMVFEKNKKNVAYYHTPYGSLLIGIDAKKIEMTESEESIQVAINYDLDVNYEFLANCNITMNIKSKEAGNFQL